MERKFKHKLTNKVIKIGGKTGLSCQTLIGNSNLILGDIIKGEDWQEIIEKDYEILSLISTKEDKTIITYQNGGGTYSEDFFPNVYKSIDHWVKCFLSNNNPWQIYSVKRLSDGEVFTIGDYINIHSNNPCCERGTIVDFSFIININNISHIKQPLFTTEDGVDIFEGNEYWCAHNDKFGVVSMKWTVNNTPYVASKLIIYNYNTINGKQKVNKYGNFYFSTKEKAEEYILMNKPCLSLNDIYNLTCKESGQYNESDLEKLVKSKL